MQTWRLINTGPDNGFYNMAVDEAMVIACREGTVLPTLRFYTWNPPCISIGYFQKHDRVLEKVQADNGNYEIVRRITGGRAVIHGNDLSYSVVCGSDNRVFPNNLKGTYIAIADAFVIGLSHLGLNNKILDKQTEASISGPKYQHSTLCFDAILGHEISVDGKKLIGSAQRRWPDIFLQHGSVMIDGNPEGNGLHSVSLFKLIQGRIDIKEVINAICAGFREVLNINLIEDRLSPYEIDLSEKLVNEKYRSESWGKRYI